LWAGIVALALLSEIGFAQIIGYQINGMPYLDAMIQFHKLHAWALPMEIIIFIISDIIFVQECFIAFFKEVED
jgi:hypothetical protein